MDLDIHTLADDEQLFSLLHHYHDPEATDRAQWKERRMPDAEGEGASLTRNHGLLLAAAWLEVNLGSASRWVEGRVLDCYRLTAAGRSAIKKAALLRAGQLDEAD